MNYKLVFILALMTSIIWGQKKQLLADIECIIPKNSEQVYRYAFQSNDEIKIRITINGALVQNQIALLGVQNQTIIGKIDQKEVEIKHKVLQAGVHTVVVKNKGMLSMPVTIYIERRSETKWQAQKSTDVVLQKVYDTTYVQTTQPVLVATDTIVATKTRQKLQSQKRYETLFYSKTIKIGGKGTSDATQISAFDLPKNTQTSQMSNELVAWAYALGVGEEGQSFWQEHKKTIVNTVQGITTYFTSPLGGIAAGITTQMILPSGGENVVFELLPQKQFLLKKAAKKYAILDAGNSVATYKKIIQPEALQGHYVMVLQNDNWIQPIMVTLKITAIMEQKNYTTETYIDKEIKPRFEQKIITEPQIISKEKWVPKEN